VIEPRSIFDALHRTGVVWSGVPCSILDGLQSEAEARGAYVPAHEEGEAIAIAAGAWLAGGSGVALIQNSGLGNAVNPIVSLLTPYRIPATVVVSWRGEPGGTADASHHRPMGDSTEPLLGLLGARTSRLRDATPDVIRSDADQTAEERALRAWLVSRGDLAAGPRRQGTPKRGHNPAVVAVFGGGGLPDREDVLRALVPRFEGVPLISTTGFISRDVAAAGERDSHFYMQGSMGFALGIGIGVATVRRDRPLLVVDGDGALLMRLGSLATAALASPRGLRHVAIDDRAYDSTGGQPSATRVADLGAAAAACGYARVARCEGASGLSSALDWLAHGPEPGPAFLHVVIERRARATRPRPEASPVEVADRFRAFLRA
jgi:phosphonopyruvate decarboxylase